MNAQVVSIAIIGGSKGRGAPGTRAPWGGQNSFIFMQFSAKSLKNNPTLGVGAPLRKILNPPLAITVLMHHWFEITLADLTGTRDARSPTPAGPNSFIFMQFSAKKVSTITEENPGSATELVL